MDTKRLHRFHKAIIFFHECLLSILLHALTPLTSQEVHALCILRGWEDALVRFHCPTQKPLILIQPFFMHDRILSQMDLSYSTTDYTFQMQYLQKILLP